VIATHATGHSDILDSENSIAIAVKGECTLSFNQQPFARWPEPLLDDAIDKLEWAHQNRERLIEIGQRAAGAMASRTWRSSAETFRRIILETGRSA